LSYTHRKSAGQSGTNRITQAEISSEFWRSFPVQVKTEKLQSSLGEKSGAGHIFGCNSSTGPVVLTETFSVALNSTSVFMGGSIVQYWPLPMHNGGIAGQTTAQVLERFKSDVLGHGYVWVIILCGTNDVLQNIPNLMTEVTDNLRAMGKIATDAGMEVVLSELPPATSNDVDLNPTISILNASIAQLALERDIFLWTTSLRCLGIRSLF
jgi:hypothetical protein